MSQCPGNPVLSPLHAMGSPLVPHFLVGDICSSLASEPRWVTQAIGGQDASDIVLLHRQQNGVKTLGRLMSNDLSGSLSPHSCIQPHFYGSETHCWLVLCQRMGPGLPCKQRHGCVCVCVLSLQLYLTLHDPMGCSLPGSSVHGVLQARIWEWIALPSSRGSSQPRDGTRVS